MKRVQYFDGWIGVFESFNFNADGHEDAARQLLTLLSQGATGWTTPPDEAFNVEIVTGGAGPISASIAVTQATTLLLPSGYAVHFPECSAHTVVAVCAISGDAASAYAIPDYDFDRVMFSKLRNTLESTASGISGIDANWDEYSVCAYNYDSSAWDTQVYPYLADRIAEDPDSVSSGESLMSAQVIITSADPTASLSSTYLNEYYSVSSRQVIPSPFDYPELQLIFEISSGSDMSASLVTGNAISLPDASAIPTGTVSGSSSGRLDRYFADTVINAPNMNDIYTYETGENAGLPAATVFEGLQFSSATNNPFLDTSGRMTRRGTWLPSGASASTPTDLPEGISPYVYVSGNDLIMFAHLPSTYSASPENESLFSSGASSEPTTGEDGTSGVWDEFNTWVSFLDAPSANDYFSGAYREWEISSVPGWADSPYVTVTGITATISARGGGPRGFLQGPWPYIDNVVIYVTPYGQSTEWSDYIQISATSDDASGNAYTSAFTGSWPASTLSGMVMGISGSDLASAADEWIADYDQLEIYALCATIGYAYSRDASASVWAYTPSSNEFNFLFGLTDGITDTTPGFFYEGDAYGILLDGTMSAYDASGGSLSNYTLTGHDGGYVAFIRHPVSGLLIFGGSDALTNSGVNISFLTYNPDLITGSFSSGLQIYDNSTATSAVVTGSKFGASASDGSYLGQYTTFEWPSGNAVLIYDTLKFDISGLCAGPGGSGTAISGSLSAFITSGNSDYPYPTDQNSFRKVLASAVIDASSLSAGENVISLTSARGHQLTGLSGDPMDVAIGAVLKLDPQAPSSDGLLDEYYFYNSGASDSSYAWGDPGGANPDGLDIGVSFVTCASGAGGPLTGGWIPDKAEFSVWRYHWDQTKAGGGGLSGFEAQCIDANGDMWAAQYAATTDRWWYKASGSRTWENASAYGVTGMDTGTISRLDSDSSGNLYAHRVVGADTRIYKWIKATSAWSLIFNPPGGTVDFIVSEDDYVYIAERDQFYSASGCLKKRAPDGTTTTLYSATGVSNGFGGGANTCFLGWDTNKVLYMVWSFGAPISQVWYFQHPSGSTTAYAVTPNIYGGLGPAKIDGENNLWLGKAFVNYVQVCPNFPTCGTFYNVIPHGFNDDPHSLDFTTSPLEGDGTFWEMTMGFQGSKGLLQNMSYDGDDPLSAYICTFTNSDLSAVTGFETVICSGVQDIPTMTPYSGGAEWATFTFDTTGVLSADTPYAFVVMVPTTDTSAYFLSYYTTGAASHYKIYSTESTGGDPTTIAWGSGADEWSVSASSRSPLLKLSGRGQGEGYDALYVDIIKHEDPNGATYYDDVNVTNINTSAWEVQEEESGYTLITELCGVSASLTEEGIWPTGGSFANRGRIIGSPQNIVGSMVTAGPGSGIYLMPFLPTEDILTATCGVATVITSEEDWTDAVVFENVNSDRFPGELILAATSTSADTPSAFNTLGGVVYKYGSIWNSIYPPAWYTPSPQITLGSGAIGKVRDNSDGTGWTFGKNTRFLQEFDPVSAVRDALFNDPKIRIAFLGISGRFKGRDGHNSEVQTWIGFKDGSVYGGHSHGYGGKQTGFDKNNGTFWTPRSGIYTPSYNLQWNYNIKTGKPWTIADFDSISGVGFGEWGIWDPFTTFEHYLYARYYLFESTGTAGYWISSDPGTDKVFNIDAAIPDNTAVTIDISGTSASGAAAETTYADVSDGDNVGSHDWHYVKLSLTGDTYATPVIHSIQISVVGPGGRLTQGLRQFIKYDGETKYKEPVPMTVSGNPNARHNLQMGASVAAYKHLLICPHAYSSGGRIESIQVYDTINERWFSHDLSIYQPIGSTTGEILDLQNARLLSYGDPQTGEIITPGYRLTYNDSVTGKSSSASPTGTGLHSTVDSRPSPGTFLADGNKTGGTKVRDDDNNEKNEATYYFKGTDTGETFSWYDNQDWPIDVRGGGLGVSAWVNIYSYGYVGFYPTQRTRLAPMWRSLYNGWTYTSYTYSSPQRVEFNYSHGSPPGLQLVEFDITGSDSIYDPYHTNNFGITTANVGNIYAFGMQDQVKPGGYYMYELAVCFNYTGYDTTGVVTVTGDMGAELSPGQDSVSFILDWDDYTTGSRATTAFVVAYGKNDLAEPWAYAGSGSQASGYRYMKADVTLSGNGNDSPTFRSVTMTPVPGSAAVINVPTYAIDNTLYTFSDGSQYVQEGIITVELADPLVVYVKEEQ